jgi:Glyoxalase/Bleomycin resistance protein/Dioxygenase superfamily
MGMVPMGELTTIEAKAFAPARDFVLSKQFYLDLGFEVAWSSDDLAYVRKGRSSFLLQRFYNKEHADNFMMHLLVDDVDAWWRHVQAKGLIDNTACGRRRQRTGHGVSAIS